MELQRTLQQSVNLETIGNTKHANNILTIRLYEGLTYKSYARTKMNFIAILTSVGALSSSFFIIGYGFTLMFSYNLMMSSLIRQLYWFKPLGNELTAEEEKKAKAKKKVYVEDKKKTKTIKEDIESYLIQTMDEADQMDNVYKMKEAEFKQGATPLRESM